MESPPTSITDPVPARASALRCRTCETSADRHCQQAGHDIEGLDRDAPTIRPEAVEAAELRAKLEAYVVKLRRYRDVYLPDPAVAARYDMLITELGAILAGTYDPREGQTP